MALRYAGIAVEQREVAMRDKPAELLALSPKATVPMLRLTDGTVIDQSLDIMAWALEQSDPDGWRTLENTAPAKHWVGLNDDTFKPLLDRYKYAGRYPECSMQQHREKGLNAFIRPLDQQLQSASHLLGSRVGWADAAIFPFVRQFAMVDRPWFDAQPLAALQHWLARWLASDLFLAVMDRKAVA